jgi:hypothetical protein
LEIVRLSLLEFFFCGGDLNTLGDTVKSSPLSISDC